MPGQLNGREQGAQQAGEPGAVRGRQVGRAARARRRAARSKAPSTARLALGGEPHDHAAAVVGVGVALDEARGRRAGRPGWSWCRWSPASRAAARPGESSYGAPARRSAASTSNSHGSMPWAVNASRRARSRCRASRLIRLKTATGAEVEVGALAAPTPRPARPPRRACDHRRSGRES